MGKKKKEFDRYAAYKRSVQSPCADCDFLAKTFRELRGRAARVMREDFCGTFANCCEWVKRHPENHAIGVDLDPEPLEYGRKNYLPKLKPAQQKRITTIQDSVLTVESEKVDFVVALNFSYYLFKTRMLMRQYFRRARKALKPDGLMILDCFGGPLCHKPNEEVTKIGNLKYYWEQESFNPITSEAVFHIHFKRPGEKKRLKVFSYDWRMWTIPEIRELLLEAGFSKTHVYWEGTTRSGEGDNNFKRREIGDPSDAWIAYVVGEP